MTFEAIRLTRATSVTSEKAGSRRLASAVVRRRRSAGARPCPSSPTPTEESMKTRLSLLAATAAIAFTQMAHATEVAPYFETWAYGGGYNPSTLMQARSAGGVTAATMALGVSGGGCSMGGGLEANLSSAGKTDIVNFQAAGGRVILSFGGASGTYLEGACSDDGMYNLIKNALDTTGARAIDFDVEGSQISSGTLNTRRN